MTVESISSFETEEAEAGSVRPRAAKAVVASCSWAKTLCKDAVLLIVIVLLAEMLLRTVAPEYGHDFYDRQLTASCPVTFNADGYRGPAVAKAKAPGETRILAMGDSTTFGTGVSANDTWPLQLRDMLAADSDHPVSAMNVALQGTALADLTYGYEHQWASYQPDVVVALVSGNMVSFAWMQRDMPPRMPPYVYPDHQTLDNGFKTQLSHAYGRLCLPHFISVNMQRALFWAGVLDHRIADPGHPYGALLAHGWVQPDLSRNEIEEAWQVLGKQLLDLKNATSAHGTKLVVAFSPCRFDLSNSLFDDEKNLPRDRLTIDPDKRLAEMCHANGITFVDVLPALRDARVRLTQERGHTAPMYILFDYNHLDHDGHHAVAAALLPDVQEVHPPLAALSAR